jgi:hypothetical protein
MHFVTDYIQNTISYVGFCMSSVPKRLHLSIYIPTYLRLGKNAIFEGMSQSGAKRSHEQHAGCQTYTFWGFMALSA